MRDSLFGTLSGEEISSILLRIFSSDAEDELQYRICHIINDENCVPRLLIDGFQDPISFGEAMLIITPEARTILQNLLDEHPEEKVVRLALKDLDEQRLAINISLEHAPHSEDHIQEHDGIILAIAANSVSRLDGATLQYVHNAFRLEHPAPPLRELRLISPN